VSESETHTHTQRAANGNILEKLEAISSNDHDDEMSMDVCDIDFSTEI
jgi:hypothetical protein